MKKIKAALFILTIMTVSTTAFGCKGLCNHNYEITGQEEATCEKDGFIERTCTECGDIESEVLPAEHQYVIADCLSYMECKYCKKQNDVFVYHTTDRGICDLCGEHFISKANQLYDEEIRHQKAMTSLQTSYESQIRKIESRISSTQSSCIYSEAECRSKISELNSEISSLEYEISHLGSGSINSAKKVNLRMKIQNLETEKSKWQEYLNRYSTLRSLELQKLSIEDDYYDAVDAEYAKYNRNIARIEALDY